MKIAICLWIQISNSKIWISLDVIPLQPLSFYISLNFLLASNAFPFLPCPLLLYIFPFHGHSTFSFLTLLSPLTSPCFQQGCLRARGAPRRFRMRTDAPSASPPPDTSLAGGRRGSRGPSRSHSSPPISGLSWKASPLFARSAELLVSHLF